MADHSDKTLTDSVHAFSEYCRRERRFVPASQAGSEAVLRSFLNFLKSMGFDPDRSTPEEVTPDTVRGYLAHLLEERGLRPLTAAAHLTALRIFYRYLVGFPPDQVLTAKVRSPWSLSVPVTVTSVEVARLLEGASRTPTPQRDVAWVQ